jgi:multidrug efflux pump subunit AcrA (membrane-fusion protein)
MVEENDRVEPGQVLAEIDPVPYRDQVNIARSKVDTAQAERSGSGRPTAAYSPTSI